MPRVLPFVVVVALAAGSVVAGAVIGDAADAPSTERALPRVGEPLPVLVPVSGADTGVGDTSGASGGGPAEDTGGASDSGAEPAADDGAASIVYPFEDLPASESGGGLGFAPLRFEDPCAVVVSLCEGVGVGATVLGDDDPPPFDIVAVSPGVCDVTGATTVERGTPFAIITTAPGSFVITLRDRNRDRSELTAAGETDTDETERWLGRLTSTFVLTCLGVTLPNRSTEWDVTVNGNAGTARDTFETVYVSVGGGGRPPVEVRTGALLNSDRVEVTAPAKSGEGSGVLVTLSTLVCGAAERFEVGSSIAPEAPTGPYAGLDAPGYPFDQAYDHYVRHVFGPGLEAGKRYSVCIWWFEHGRIVERASYPLHAPNRYSFRFTGHIDFRRDRVPSEYEVHVRGICSFGFLGAVPLPSAEASATFGGGGCAAATFEHLLAFIAADSFANVLTLEVEVEGERNPSAVVEPGAPLTHRGRYVFRAALELPLSPCPPSGGPCSTSDRVLGPCEEDARATCATFGETTKTYRVPLSVTVGLCGGSGRCDPPRNRVGTVSLEFRFLPIGPADGSRNWVVGAEEPFESA